ncbi:MAG TPA: isoprenylcysteine carboxylmethyltransferase family protein [Pseudolabrys sp.]|nr:isoprenylcysteine carboxylmethyltransferase family protein [Pseudolabrys sp.]
MDAGLNGAAPAIRHSPSLALRKLVIALTISLSIGFLFVAGSYWRDGGFVHECIEWMGVVLIVTCILGRTWCQLYIGGRKHIELVTQGPYSVSRNPLYLFSIVGALGIGAQFGSLTVALVCGIFAWAVFLWTAWREEAAMLEQFHDEYRRYLERVPRFMPRLAMWESPTTLLVHPRTIVTTFLDALLFLVAIPLVELFEYLHDTGLLPLYFTLP